MNQILRFVKQNKTTIAIGGAALAAYWLYKRRSAPKHIAGYYVPGMFPENYTAGNAIGWDRFRGPEHFGHEHEHHDWDQQQHGWDHHGWDHR